MVRSYFRHRLPRLLTFYSKAMGTISAVRTARASNPQPPSLRADTVRPGHPPSWWCSAPPGWLPGCCSTTTITSQPGATPTPTIALPTSASGWRRSGFPGRWSPRTLAKLGVRGPQLEIRALIQPSGWREDNIVEAKGPRGVTHNTGVKESSPVELSGSGGNPTQ